MILDIYKQRQHELSDALNKLHDLAKIRQDQHIVEHLSFLNKKLEENRFYLVVLGQFKRGKSTFINSLLGAPLLPTAIVPLTSIVTMIRYGAEERVDVHFENGEQRAISRNELVNYVTEKGNPGNAKQVAQVEICYPSSYLKDGVRFIDTPGVDSVFSDNTRVTHDFLPQVDAALFLLAGDPPISQPELDFLKQVKQHVAKIFFIQNKVDLLDASDRQESLEFSQRVIKDALEGGEVQIYPLSAKHALDAKLSGDQDRLRQSFLPDFDQKLGEFLMREKGRVFLQSVLRSGRKLLADEKFAIRLEQKAMTTPIEELERKTRLFEEKLSEIQEQKQDNDYLYEAEIKRLSDLLDRDIEKLQKRTLPKLLDALQRSGENSTHLPIGEYHHLLEQTLHSGIIHTFDAWVEKEEQRLNDEYAKISQRFSLRTNEIIEALMQASAQLFDLPLEQVKIEETINADSRFYYLLGDRPHFFDLEGAFDAISRTFLPIKIVQRKILRDLLNKLPQKIDVNCGRVRADFTYRIQESFRKFRSNLNLTIDATVESIQHALQQAVEMQKAGKQELEHVTARLERQHLQIESLEQDFQSLEKNLNK